MDEGSMAWEHEAEDELAIGGDDIGATAAAAPAGNPIIGDKR